MFFTFRRKYPFGLLAKDPTDIRDYQLASIQKPVEESHLPKEYNLRSQMTPVGKQNWGTCFPAGTPVLMEDFSEKPIEKVRVFDYVYTHKKQIKRVTRIYKRPVKNIWELKIRGGSHSIRATEEHPFWVMPFIGKDSTKKRKVTDNLDKPRFIKLKDIKKGDYVGIPIIKDSQEPSLTILKNKDFLRFLGYYLAEGSLELQGDKSHKEYGRITFTLNIEEKDFAKDIIKISKKLFNLKAKVSEEPEQHVLRVRIYDPALAELIEKLCSHLSWKKKLHPSLMKLEPSLQKEILLGWFRGDGYSKNTYRIGTTVSLPLSRQLWWIGIRNEIPISWKLHSYIGLGRRQAYDIAWSENKDLRQTFFKDGYLWCRAVSKEKILLRQNVYNLEVKDDDSYIAQGLAVHNCTCWSACAVKEFWDKQEYQTDINLSEKFVYHNMKKISGLWNTEGDYLVNALKSICKYGAPLISDYPDKRDSSWYKYVHAEPSPEIYKKAEKYKGKTYWAVGNRMAEIMSAVYQNHCPITLGMRWFPSFYTIKSDGKLPLPSGNSYGGHAFAFVGWTQGKLWFKNSWGVNFGNRGYFYIPFENYDKYEIWNARVLLDIVIEKQEGWVATKYLQTKVYGKGTIVSPKVYLHLRNEPAIKSQILTTLKEGQKCIVEDDKVIEANGYRWQKVKVLKDLTS